MDNLETAVKKAAVHANDLCQMARENHAHTLPSPNAAGRMEKEVAGPQAGVLLLSPVSEQPGQPSLRPRGGHETCTANTTCNPTALEQAAPPASTTASDATSAIPHCPMHTRVLEDDATSALLDVGVEVGGLDPGGLRAVGEPVRWHARCCV